MIIVDGYNVIHKWSSLIKYKGNLELARSRLIEMMSNYQGYIGERVLIVFDSKTGSDVISDVVPGNIEVKFAYGNQSADMFIERFVYSHEAPSQITVVTGDRLFRMTVTQKNVSLLTPEQFEKEVWNVCYGKE